MSLMAELGQGPIPPATMAPSGAGITGVRPQIHQHQSQVMTAQCIILYLLLLITQ